MKSKQRNAGSPPLNKADVKAREREWQDNIGNQVIERSFQWPGTRLIFEHQFKLILNEINSAEKGMILEIGCGRGQLLEYLSANLDARVPLFVGLDISTKLAELKQKYPPRLKWITADGERLPFAADAFDTIVYNGSLHHLPDFKDALHDALRCLKKNGRIIFLEPVSTFFSRLVLHLQAPFVFKQVEFESPVDHHYKDNFKLKELKTELERSGIHYRLSWHDFLAYPLTRCYKGSFLSSRPRLVGALLRFEYFLRRIPVIRSLCNAVSWRLLMVIDK
ncbi:MAG: class I SAM-dependent methyltransferase [Candidatus Aminicenantes bacterium]|nr:class I SAM-dependent methyltransferase [Candidatus Aminicenantes bacterium]